VLDRALLLTMGEEVEAAQGKTAAAQLLAPLEVLGPLLLEL